MKLIQPILAVAAVVLITACANGHSQSQPVNDSASKNMAGARPGMPDLSETAEKLGVSEDAIHQAMRNAGGPPPDLEKAAAELGVSVEALKAALPEMRRPPQ